MSASIAVAGAPPSGGIEVEDAWIRWLPANLPNAGYITLKNTGRVTRVLIGASSGKYQDVHMHQTVQHNGMMSMHPVTSIEIKPQDTVQFTREGYHFMLMQPRRSLHPGDHVKVTLQFQQGPPLEADFIVRDAPAS